MRRWMILMLTALAFVTFSTSLATAQVNPIQIGKTLQSSATTTGNGSTLDTSQMSTVALQVIGSFTATIVPEGSLDGTTYAALTCYPLGSTTGATSFTAAGIWRCNITSIPLVRARISSCGSCASGVTVRAQAISVPFDLGTATP